LVFWLPPVTLAGKLQHSSTPNFLRLLLVINQSFGQAILGQTYFFTHLLDGIAIINQSP
jgi:hypothetical protein